MVANVLAMVLTWGVARRRLRLAGQRAAHPDRFAGRSRRRDVALTVASLVPAALFWGMVLAGSFHGLVAFGRNTLDWNDGSEYLVPGTLDGVSVTFGFLAFRAVHKRRDPARSQRVVWAASLASATVNFAYEYSYTHHNVVAGLYTGLLSLFGVTIFHEFLAQFEEGAEYVRRGKRPPWGLRWVTAPVSTFRAADRVGELPAGRGNADHGPGRACQPGTGTPDQAGHRGTAGRGTARARSGTSASTRRAGRREGCPGSSVPERAVSLVGVSEPRPMVAVEPRASDSDLDSAPPPAATRPRSEIVRPGRANDADAEDESGDVTLAEPKIPTQAATVAQWAAAVGADVRGRRSGVRAPEQRRLRPQQLRSVRPSVEGHPPCGDVRQAGATRRGVECRATWRLHISAHPPGARPGIPAGSVELKCQRGRRPGLLPRCL